MLCKKLSKSLEITYLLHNFAFVISDTTKIQSLYLDTSDDVEVRIWTSNIRMGF